MLRGATSARGNRTAIDEGAPFGKFSLVTTILHLWPYIWPKGQPELERRVLYCFALLIIGKLVNALVPYTFKWATDALQSHLDASATNLLVGAAGFTVLYGMLRALYSLLTQARDAIFAAVAMHAVKKLAIDVFDHMHRLSMRYHVSRKTGGLTRILERGRDAIETLARLVMSTGLPTIVEFLLVLGIFAWQFNWRYSLAAATTIAVYLAYTTLATNWRIDIRRKMNDSDIDANVKAIDSLLNYETVKYFCAEERESARYEKSMERYRRASVESYTSLAVLNAGQAAIFTLGLALMMLMCVSDLKDSEASVGDFVLINATMIQLYQPLNFMGTFYREVRQAVIDIERMFQILSRHPEIDDRPGATGLAISKGRIVFDEVTFGYERARPILDQVSFCVQPGKTLAIVGPSGAGKSTISRLIFRFYEPQSGRILIDGQDILTVTQKSLRAAIGMVPQDTVLFNDTIGYNIRYGRWEASEAEIREAARLAQIDRFIESIPAGYDAQVGERGLKLSGGEKQRVAIARTILKEPRILVLDEATSALDSFTEHEIQGALRGVSKGRTTLVIAHRLSTIVDADEIIFLDKGRIVERGSHQALLAEGGAYAAMWNRQREASEAQAVLEVAQAEGLAE
ncbi:ABCB family ABC transporter ATP-binding protein/permease [Methylocystis bryophila]|uniref:Metal ABC transporter permease n=1 Tax=Methylocystis bryophila TaxID=655015 RepID=A0A1W6MYQ6_9HYPH|nr:ABC transporter ATP-binding protein/permease [Methylocystis bryophila]ARN82721.1 metal ABC transporter permease [Methylocystis bryophila]BDV38952.1 ABC transporter ATP-binding protein/permease [Methylocystis bryophila]